MEKADRPTKYIQLDFPEGFQAFFRTVQIVGHPSPRLR